MNKPQAVNPAIQEEAGEKHGKDTVKSLIKVFWILLAVTVLEVALALLHFELHFLNRDILNKIFILLTLVKAYYIVAEFMHFRQEKKSLALIILLPLFFLVWGIGATMWEGHATKEARSDVEHVIYSPKPWELHSMLEKKP